MQKRALIAVIVLILILATVVSSSYRGIGHDEGLGSFRRGAERIVAGQPVFDAEEGIGDAKDPARLVYIVFIALGYRLFGFSLVALHIFPYLFQILNSCLFFLVAYQFYKNIWWGFVAALFFIFHPFSVVFLNQQHNHPFFVCFMLLILLGFERMIKHPKLLLVLGFLSALLILTRLEDGVLFVFLFYALYVAARWKRGLPVQWLLGSFGVLFFSMLICAYVFDFPLTYPFSYVAELAHRQTDYGSHTSYIQLTLQALRNFLNWYVAGKLLAPFLGLFLIVGTFIHLKNRTFVPLGLLAPYWFFLLFIYNGRYEIIFLPVATFSVPVFLLVIVSGIQAVSAYGAVLTGRVKQRATPGRRPVDTIAYMVICVVILLGILGGLARATYSLAIIVEDAQPASTMWQIVTNNPPMPGNPAYQTAYIQLTREDRLEVRLREELYKRVRGAYRSWYLHRIGREAFERGLPEKSRQQADFVYYDTFDSTQQWEADRLVLEGESPLWSDEYPGRLGAFPVGKSGSFVYQFDFPRPIDYVIISDVHTQWGFGDITKMWTSTDGQDWTLRCNNWNVRYTEDPYYQFFEDEFDGQTTLFVKYAFHAGDTTRTGNDNRGASLDEFSLAVYYQP